jgi:Ca2+:H+ antiporter
MRRAWTVLPVLAIVATLVTWGSHPLGLAAVALEVVLAGAVLAAVHHTEVPGHRLGEPF